jgi:glucosamine-6-phosphate deaminase
MEVIIGPNKSEAVQSAARIIAKELRARPQLVVGLATGSTPLLLYREFVQMNLDWSSVTTFNLDEYVGLPGDHPASYHKFMWENLFGQVNVAKSNVHIPDGLAKDIPDSCRRYEEAIQLAGGIDLQVLGIGTEGHIGFNEPGSSLASRTRIKTLTMQTRADNAQFFGSAKHVPHHVITMGVGTIMEARQILLLAFGKNKARAVAQAVEGPVTAMCPASVLQMHRSVRIVLDKPAAGQLTKADYYRWVYDNKPDWQKA